MGERDFSITSLVKAIEIIKLKLLMDQSNETNSNVIEGGNTHSQTHNLGFKSHFQATWPIGPDFEIFVPIVCGPCGS